MPPMPATCPRASEHPTPTAPGKHSTSWELRHRLQSQLVFNSSAPHIRAACLAPSLSLSRYPPPALGLMLATPRDCVYPRLRWSWLGLGSAAQLPLLATLCRLILHLGRRPSWPRYVIPGPGPDCKPVTEDTPGSLARTRGKLGWRAGGLLVDQFCHRRSSDLPWREGHEDG